MEVLHRKYSGISQNGRSLYQINGEGKNELMLVIGRWAHSAMVLTGGHERVGPCGIM